MHCQSVSDSNQQCEARFSGLWTGRNEFWSARGCAQFVCNYFFSLKCKYFCTLFVSKFPELKAAVPASEKSCVKRPEVFKVPEKKSSRITVTIKLRKVQFALTLGSVSLHFFGNPSVLLLLMLSLDRACSSLFIFVIKKPKRIYTAFSRKCAF